MDGGWIGAGMGAGKEEERREGGREGGQRVGKGREGREKSSWGFLELGVYPQTFIKASEALFLTSQI